MNRLNRLRGFFKAASGQIIVGPGDRDSSSAGMVSMIQSALNDLGYDLQVDGIFGEETAGAVFAFKSLNNLEESSSVDMESFLKLFSPEAKEFDESFRPQKIRNILESIETDDGLIESRDTVSKSALFSDLMSSLSNKNLCIAMVANAIHESALNPGIAGDCGDYAVRKSDRAVNIGGKGLCCSFGLWQLNICGGLGIKILGAKWQPN